MQEIRLSRQVWSLVVLVIALFVVHSAALAQHEHDHDHDSIEFPEPTNFVDAAAQALEIVGHLQTDLASGDFDHIHDDSIILARVARMLGRFALDSDRVARQHVREINVAGRELGLLADRLHDASDGRDEMACRRLLSAMTPHLAVIETNLKRLAGGTYAVSISAAASPIRAGESATLEIEIKDDAGHRVMAFDTVHEAPLHVIVVSEDLGWFAHHHPTQKDDGRFELTLQFPAGGTYRLFHDFKPKDMHESIGHADVAVAGDPLPSARLSPNIDQSQHVGGYDVEPHGIGPIHAKQEAALWFVIRQHGKPVERLQPYLGERGHLVAVSSDLRQYVHAHPVSESHEGHDHDHAHEHSQDNDHDGRDVLAAALGFHAKFPEPGLYRMWVEFKHDDKIHHAAFTVNVEPESSHDHHDHSHGERHGDQH